MYVLFAFVVSLLSYPASFSFVAEHIRWDMSAFNCECVCLGRLPTYRDISPKFGYVIVVGAEELGEPADGSLAAFVHCLISLEVLIVFVDRVVGQMHVELAL